MYLGEEHPLHDYNMIRKYDFKCLGSSFLLAGKLTEVILNVLKRTNFSEEGVR